jgi:hypothetical protein
MLCKQRERRIFSKAFVEVVPSLIVHMFSVVLGPSVTYV